jgi:hypothetical protein
MADLTENSSVSDDFPDFERRHELITAAPGSPQLGRLGPADEGLDDESAELRATWLAFGKLLDTARADLAAARGSRSSEWIGKSPTPVRHRPRFIQVAVAVAALAATLLVAITAAWHIHGGLRTAVPQLSPEVAVKSPDAPHSAAVNSGGRVGVTSPLSTAGTVLPAAPMAGVLAAADRRSAAEEWNDPLDQQLDRAGRAVVQVQDDTLASADRLGLIQYKVENIRHDIEDEGDF